uniref:DUF4134 domain-containing protein n=1 Tax=candidate division CPR3 bacterium TaxID=2268181 RepID=A0A7C4R819_UNCC3
MLNKIKFLSSIIASFVVLLTSKIALAATSITGTQGGFKNDIGDTINNALTYVLGIAGLIALFYIIGGGFTYLTSSGNPEKVQNATKMITYSIIGVVIIALAFAIKNFLLGTLFGIDRTSTIQF